jgi:hypothetical protein
LLQLLSLYRKSGRGYREKEEEEEEEQQQQQKQQKQQQDGDRLRLQLLDRRLGKKSERGAEERSRLLAERIAESALLLGQRKGRVLEETAKRDVDIAASTSAASSTAVDASLGVGGAAVGTSAAGELSTSGALSTAGAVNVAGSTSVAAAGGVADATLGVSGGLRVEGGTSLAAGLAGRPSLGLGPGLLGQLGSYQGLLPGKAIMDMAIQEASAMIRRLAYETRGEVACKADPEFERRVLGLAIDLVNKVSLVPGVELGGKLDLLAGYGYGGLDDYLKATAYDAELEAGLLTNAGFDYLRHRDLLEGRRLYDDLDLYDDYLGRGIGPYARGRCDSCSKYDMRMGNICPLCKRSGTGQKKLLEREKRADDRDGIRHLERALHRQNKVNNIR